ncbi:transporter, cation channel family protein [Besnoitia besnoiti]|uniref:Transporter, cation channel family protein n=1 Tax=Besnoitia besnoiti TaxID=94643 RepID=A0A2A9M6E5_BESBE|nr:transporter, cation channel family protein [Besnoitia besnoiti]PFH30980.1 transporter, cation channel family protein [Besnoitia besnoiti]
MPTRAAIDTSNLQRMYSLASPKIVGRRKAWRALSEFLRPRSLPNQEAPTFSNTSSGAAWMLQRLTQSISRASTLRRRSQRASANGSRPPERRPGGLRFRRDKQRAVAAHAVSFWRRGRRRESKRGPATESERPSPGQTRPSDATGGVLSGDCCQAQPTALRYPAGGLCGRQRNHGADDVEGLWAVNPGSDTHLASTRPDDAALSVHSATDAAGDGAVDGPEGPLSLGESVCYLFTLTLICCYDAVARLVSSPFKWLNERIVSYDIDRPDAIVDFIRFILMEEGLEDASTASALPAPGVRRKREQSSVGGGDLGSQSTPTASLAFLRGGPVATLLRRLTSATAYGWALAALEVVSLLCLVVECMLTDNEQARNVFGVLEWIFAFLFLAESLLRVGAYGWCRGGCLALGSGASRAGFLVSLVSCVLLLINQTLFAADWRSYACRFVWQLPLFRLVKVLRSFRSFHLFSLVQMEGVRIVVRSLLACTRSLVLLSAFLSLVFVMFALIFSRIMRVGYVPPDNPNEVLYTFQTFFEASIGVFVLATNEGWPLLLSRLLDRNPTQQVALSVLVFLFISAVSIFGVKMCVGIIVDASRRKKARMEMEGSLLSATVHKWIEIQELLFNSALQHGDTMPDFTGVDSKRLAMARKKAAALITSGCFRMAVAVHTCLCCLLLFFYGPWYDMTLGPHRQGRRLELHIAIVCLSAFFFIEIGTRIFARGRLFFREALDILDVVLCCLLAGTFGAGVVLWMGWVWRVDALTSWLLSLRLFRIARFLYRQMPFFQTLFTTISRVMKSFLSVLTLLGLSIFFFAIWGVVLFSGAPVETYFNRHANFKMLPRAVMALIGSCTGEDWHMILQQLRMHYTATDQKLLRVTVVVFFISFIVLVFFILMDLFTTAVLDEYMDTVKDENLWNISCQKRVLIERWNPKDELSTNYKSLTDMIALLRTIDQPMGIKHRFHPDEKRQKVLKYIAKYGLPVYAGARVHLRDVVLNCAKRACEFHAMSHGVMDMQDGQVELNPRLISSWMGKFPELAHVETRYDLRHHLAAETLQSWFRRQRMRLHGKLANPEWCAARFVSFVMESRTAHLRRPSGRAGHRASQSDRRYSGVARRRSWRRSRVDSAAGSSQLSATASGSSSEALPQPERLHLRGAGGSDQVRMSLPESISTRGSVPGSSSNSRRGSIMTGTDVDLAPRVLFESCMLVPEGTTTKKTSSRERLSARSASRRDSLPQVASVESSPSDRHLTTCITTHLSQSEDP